MALNFVRLVCFFLEFENLQVFIYKSVSAEPPQTEEIDVDSLFEALKQRKDDSITIPTYISSVSHFLLTSKVDSFCFC